MRGCGLIVLLASMPAVVALADPAPSVDGLFYQANARYQAQQYDEAAAMYEDVLAAGVGNTAIYYNAGNAYLKGGDIGQALWAYEQARYMTPSDPDVLANLQFAQALVPMATRVQAPRIIQWLSWGRRHTTVLAGLWLIWLWAGVLCCIGWTWWINKRYWFRLGCMLTGLGIVLCGAALGTQTYWQRTHPRGIVLRDSVARFAPQRSGTEHFVLSTGSYIYVRQAEGAWVQVQRSDGRQGWVESDALRVME
jgi:tetratricopeptide (TPR) repeat protein